MLDEFDMYYGGYGYEEPVTVIEEAPKKIPLNANPRPERHGRVLGDGSFIRVWVWGSAPEGIRALLNGRLREPEFIVLSPRGCDQYSAKLFCEYVSTEYRHFGEIDYEGVACTTYVTGRDG